MRYEKVSRSVGKITLASLVVAMLSVGAASAAQIVVPIPGPPIFQPGPPPCISTGPLYEFPAGCYTCQVRNVGSNTYGATITMVTEQNQSAVMTPPSNLTPGRTIRTGFCTKGAVAISCVVTTQTGTVAALGDLAVVEQYAPGVIAEGNGSASSSASETEGEIFNSCVPSTGPINTNP